MIDSFARPYRKELLAYGKCSCVEFMDKNPLFVEHTITYHELSELIIQMEQHHLSRGFIITSNGHYLGVGSVHHLLREITDMQISAARYSNPLTYCLEMCRLMSISRDYLSVEDSSGDAILTWIISSHITTLMDSSVEMH